MADSPLNASVRKIHILDIIFIETETSLIDVAPLGAGVEVHGISIKLVYLNRGKNAGIINAPRERINIVIRTAENEPGIVVNESAHVARVGSSVDSAAANYLFEKIVNVVGLLKHDEVAFDHMAAVLGLARMKVGTARAHYR